MRKPERRDQKLHADAAARDIKFFREREEERLAGEQKTARLRALRLAKEAQDRVTATAQAEATAAAKIAAKAAAKTAAKRAKAAKPTD